jgi:hypothetical protein
MVVTEVFGEPAPGAPLAGHATMLEALQAGIAGQLAVPDDASAASARQATPKVKAGCSRCGGGSRTGPAIATGSRPQAIKKGLKP